MANTKSPSGAQFVKYFGPLLDALRALGGSAIADEAVASSMAASRSSSFFVR